ncbi:hypothetical protein WSM22_03050 [Cytophagales bacterium WSM2-2]|nr:hypothetical protein WSM22_03050 [Cytophagales bacterium WSM2-2]
MNSHRSQETFDKIYDLVEPRLNELGVIRTGDVYKLVGGQYRYCRFCTYFNQIMRSMVELGKARYVVKGQWLIVKPNNPMV